MFQHSPSHCLYHSTSLNLSIIIGIELMSDKIQIKKCVVSNLEVETIYWTDDHSDEVNKTMVVKLV